MRTLLVVVLLALFAPNVLAQNNPTLTVHIVGKGEDSQRIAQAVTARVGSTARYTVGDSQSEFWMIVTCFAMAKVVIHPSTQGMDGYVCYYHVEYFPAQLKPFQSLLTDNFRSDKFADLVEEIFDDFVRASSDEALKVARDGIMRNVLSFCHELEHKSVCEQSKKGT